MWMITQKQFDSTSQKSWLQIYYVLNVIFFKEKYFKCLTVSSAVEMSLLLRTVLENTSLLR